MWQGDRWQGNGYSPQLQSRSVTLQQNWTSGTNLNIKKKVQHYFDTDSGRNAIVYSQFCVSITHSRIQKLFGQFVKLNYCTCHCGYTLHSEATPQNNHFTALYLFIYLFIYLLCKIVHKVHKWSTIWIYSKIKKEFYRRIKNTHTIQKERNPNLGPTHRNWL